MGKVKYNVEGVESGGRGNPPPPGIYVAKLVECEETVSKAGNDMLTCKYEIARGDFKGYPLWDYVGFADNQKFKVRQFVDATMGGKDKGVIDTNKVVGSTVQVRVKHEMYNDEPQARIGVVLPMPEDEDEEDLDDDDDLEPEDGDEEGADEELTWEDLQDMDLDDLKEIIEEDELDIRVTKRSKVETIRAKVAEELEIEEPEEEEEPDDGDEDDEDYEDYEEWSVQELKDECKERGIKATGSKGVLIKRLEKNDEEEDPF